MPRPIGTKKNSWKYLNENQLQAFKQALEEYGSLRDRVMMGLTLYLGLRVQELVNIAPKDIEADSHQITIRGLKGGRKRSYPDIEEKLWKRLYQYMKRRKLKDRVFPLTPQAVKNIFKKYAKLAELPSDLSIHSLRHTTAMLKAKAGDSPIKIMLWLRHRSITSTQRYFEQTMFEGEARDMNHLFETYL